MTPPPGLAAPPALPAPAPAEAGLLRVVALRVPAALGLTAYFFLGFNAVAALAAGREPRTLRTPLDDAIPFVPWTILLYSWVYTSAFYPVFVVRCPRVFRRVMAAYALVFTAAYTCFVAFPVTAVGLRPDVSALDTTTLVGWGVRLTYAVDPPLNLFPSLHLAVAAVAALSAFRVSRPLGLLAVPTVAAIAVTITTTKQHFILDGVGGLGLAYVAWALILRRRVSGELPSPSFGAPGALLYLAFHALVYGAFVVAFVSGYTRW